MKFLWQCFGYKSSCCWKPRFKRVAESERTRGWQEDGGRQSSCGNAAGRDDKTDQSDNTPSSPPDPAATGESGRRPQSHPCLAWWENRNVFQEGCARVWKTNILFSSRTLFTLNEKKHAHLFQNKEQNWLGLPKHLSSSIIFCWDFFVSGFTCSTSFFPFLN